jgi:hypothetical protein
MLLRYLGKILTTILIALIILNIFILSSVAVLTGSSISKRYWSDLKN